MEVRRRSVLSAVVIASPILLLLIFVVYPVTYVLIAGLLYGPGSTFAETVLSPVTQRIVAFTLQQALLSTVITVAVSLPAAALLARLEFSGKGVVRAAMIVPFVLPPIVVVVGFLRMFGPYGVIDTVAMAMSGSAISVFDLSTGLTGIILAHVFYNIPLVTLMVSSSLETLPPEVEEMAELLGATTLQKWRYVILPHIRSALGASAVLTFLFCFMSFPIVLALGQGRYSTIEVQIWSAFRYFDYGQASALALLQLGVTLVLAVAYVYLSGGVANGGRSARIKTVSFRELPRSARLLVTVYAILLLILMVGPIASIVLGAIYDPVTREFSTEGFANLLRTGVGGGLTALINSVVYAGLATLSALVLGLPLAYAQLSERAGVRGVATAMTLLPLGVSSITIAYGLMRAIAVPLRLSITPWPLIVIAQTIIGLPFSARAIEVARRNIDPELLEQADILGATRLQRLFFVELPLLAPGILVGGVFAFAMAIGEMSATLFIALPQNYTLAVAIYQYLSVRKFLEAGAAALVLVVVCLVAFLVMERVSGESAGGTI